MLQVRDLTLTHTRDLRTLAEKFSFTLNEGDKAVLIGEEGNGKSTALKLLYDPALVAPDSLIREFIGGGSYHY